MLVDKNDPSLHWVLNTVRENGLYDPADIITYHALADAINMYKKIKTDMKGAPYSHQEEGSQGQIITKAHPAAKQLFDCMDRIISLLKELNLTSKSRKDINNTGSDVTQKLQDFLG